MKILKLIHPYTGVALALAILVIHALALYKFYWYWTIPWFDMVMHAAGGFAVGLIILTLAKAYTPEIIALRTPLVVLIAVSITGLIGIGWEFYEFLYDIYFGRGYQSMLQLGVVDTLSDLFFDLSGGLIITLLFITSKKD